VPLFIAEKRRKKGLTQQSLATKVGISRTCLSMMENGKLGTKLATVIERIAQELDTDINTLFTPPPPEQHECDALSCTCACHAATPSVA